MAKRFVMGDVHGAYKALLQCLERSGFDYDNDLLIQLGDVCDGWPYVSECIDELCKIRNLIALRGNHDDWFNDFVETGFNPVQWQQGGKATALSYLRYLQDKEHLIQRSLVHSGYITALNPEDIPPLHQKFLREQHYYYKDEDNNIFVHGGFDRNYPVRDQDRYVYYWDRNLWEQACSAKGDQVLKFAEEVNKVYIGHTHVDDWRNPKALPQLEGGGKVWNLDTGAGYGGKLTIMDIDSQEYWQSDFVKELYPNELGRN